MSEEVQAIEPKPFNLLQKLWEKIPCSFTGLFVWILTFILGLIVASCVFSFLFIYFEFQYIVVYIFILVMFLLSLIPVSIYLKLVHKYSGTLSFVSVLLYIPIVFFYFHFIYLVTMCFFLSSFLYFDLA
jgi:hypothetical protein